MAGASSVLVCFGPRHDVPPCFNSPSSYYRLQMHLSGQIYKGPSPRSFFSDEKVLLIEGHLKSQLVRLYSVREVWNYFGFYGYATSVCYVILLLCGIIGSINELRFSTNSTFLISRKVILKNQGSYDM